MTKREIAKDYLNMGHTTLSKEFTLSQKELSDIFYLFFDLQNELSVAHSQVESKPKLLVALKEFLIDFKDSLDDIWDADYEAFVKELLQRANKKPAKEETTDKSAKESILSKKMRSKFIEITDAYSIMSLINRKPPVFGRSDSARFDFTYEGITERIINQYQEKCGEMTLFEDIKMFRDALRIQALTIEARLNRRCKSYDDSTSINMEGGSTESKTKPNQTEIPQLSFELFSEAEDALVIAELAIQGWGSFRNKMNLLYRKISAEILLDK